MVCGHFKQRALPLEIIHTCDLLAREEVQYALVEYEQTRYGEPGGGGGTAFLPEDPKKSGLWGVCEKLTGKG